MKPHRQKGESISITCATVQEKFFRTCNSKTKSNANLTSHPPSLSLSFPFLFSYCLIPHNTGSVMHIIYTLLAVSRYIFTLLVK